MAFSEFQYSNKRVISTGEIWTAETSSLSVNIRDVLGQGRQLTVEVSNPLNNAGTRYFEYQRVRLLDRPTNAIIFLGRIASTNSDHRKQRLTLTCTDYSTELASKNISTANLYGNRRSDIIHDVISGGTEVGRTLGSSGALNRIVDTSKKFNNGYLNRAVKIPGIGPGIVPSMASTNVIEDSTAPFDNSFINRLIRRVSFSAGRKQIDWEGRVLNVNVAGTELTLTTNGVDTRDSGGANYSLTAHGFLDDHYWEIVGFEGEITTIVSDTAVDVATVGSTSSPSYKGYKDANFYNWASGSSLSAKGGIQYFIENAEEGVHQVTTGNGHTSDKSIDLSRIDTSPYMELVRRSYSKGQGSSEGVRESIKRLARDEVWKVPQVLFFGGHLDSSLGVAPNEWMLMTAEASTGIDVLYKPTTAPLPLQKRLLYRSGSYDYHARAVTNPAHVSDSRLVTLTNQAGGTTSTGSIQSGSGMFYDAADPTRNRIQIGSEERRITFVAASGSNSYVHVDKPFTHAYTASDDVVVGIGPHVGSPRWDRTVSNQGQPASTGNPEMVANGTFSVGTTADGWVAANSSCTLDSSDGYLLLTTDSTVTGLESYCSKTVTGLTIGKQYIFSVEVARYAGGTDAAKRRIKVGTAAASYSSGWSDNGYDDYVNVDNALSNNNTFSTSNRLAWTQYSYEFKATQTTIYINLGVSDADGDQARFDSVSLREAAYDSRLYIGSSTIFNGIKFEMESSTDVYSSMDVEFWGRKNSDGVFGWYRIDDYSIEDTQGTGMYQAFWEPPGDRGIDNFNRSGTIKWYDLSLRPSNFLSQSTPNFDWNHWSKDSLVGSEPFYGDAIDTFSTDKHNHSLEGGIKATDLADPELENLYWVRLSVPSNEFGSAVDSSVNPGFIKNIKILDGRESAFNTTGTPNPPGNLGNIYDTTKRNFPQAQWDFRMEDPGFFTAIGKVDSSSSTDIWTDYTKNMTTRTGTAHMDGFSDTFNGAGRYYYFGADYKFSGIEFNLSTVGSAISGSESPLFEYWNGKIWVGIQDLHEYDFSVSGATRWDMDAIDSLESQGSNYPSYFSQTKWVKRDLRATSGAWGAYNYNSTSATANPYKPPNSSGVVQNGDASGADYPGGTDALNALNAPHHHLYWIRMSRPSSATITTPAKITTIRMFSRAAFKYFERGTEPWNFNVTGTEDVDSADYGKHEFSDAAGQFLASPASGNVWLKNTSAADYNQANATYVSASKLGLQPALSRGGVGSDTTYKVSSVTYSGIDNVDGSRLPIAGPSPTNKANELKVDQYLLVGSEKMRILSIGKPDVNGVILLEIERSVLGTSGAAHAWGVPVYLLKRTSELTTRAYLSAGLFLHGFAPTNYQGRAGSNYLLYQDKRPGLKNYETYGGDTSSTANWHGLNIKYRDFRRPQGTNLYRYSLQDMPTETVTRVTVNGRETISATAIDTGLEALYGMRQDKVVFDDTISSVGEAEASAESILASLKPAKEHAGLRAVLEIYDYPVYSYNSATTSTTDRAIPHVVRAGDVITLTINDGNYRFFDEPFLVQSITYDDQKSLAKITCTQGMFPTTTGTLTPQAQIYAAVVEARNTAAAANRSNATVPLEFNERENNIVGAEDGDGDESTAATQFSNVVAPPTEGQGPTEQSTDAQTNVVFEFVNNGIFNMKGEIPDISLTATSDSGLNKVVVAQDTSFILQAKGFTHPNRTYWLNRTIVDAAGDTFKISSVESVNIIHTTGNKTWAANDTFTVRRLSSGTRRFNANPDTSLSPAFTYSVYHDITSNTNKILNTSQVPNPNEIEDPLWATILSGFHGVGYTNNSGLLVVNLSVDHGYSGGFFHKPLVMATVDSTTGTGDTNANAYDQRAYAVVKRFTDAGGTSSAAQWGTAGSNSGIVSGSHRLHAQANNNSVSTFNSSHVGSIVLRLNALNGQEESGLVTTLVSSSQLTTTFADGFSGWKTGDKYIVYGDIQRIEIQVCVPRLHLLPAAAASTDSLLVSASGVPYTSDSAATRVDTAENYSGSSGIAVAYTIIPRSKTPLPE